MFGTDGDLVATSGRVVQRQPPNDRGIRCIRYGDGGGDRRRWDGHNLEEVDRQSVHRACSSAECVRYRRPRCRAWEPSHDDKSGLRWFSAVQPGAVAGRALMRQAARRDMQPAVSVSCLNAACMRWGRESARVGVRVCRGSGARVSSADQISRPVSIVSTVRYTAPPRRIRTNSTIIQPSSGSSIAPLAIVLLTGAARGQAVDEREPWVTSSRVRVYKPKVSHLFAFAPNRVRHSGCCMAPLFFFKPKIPLGRRTVMYLVPLYHPHARCSALHAQLVVVPGLRAQLLGKTRCEPDQKLGAPFTPDSW